ncbi:MAG: FG-GAP-like repeat-containing protein [Gemmatimonadota bacterium]
MPLPFVRTAVVRLPLLLLLFPLTAMAQQPANRLAEAQRMVAAGQPDSALPVLRALLQDEPKNGRAWLLLGATHRALGQTDSAVDAYQHAIGFPRAKPIAVGALFALSVQAHQMDAAATWFEQLRSSASTDLSGLAADTSLHILHDDARFASLFPDRITFEPPFVEPVRIIQEWRGASRGDEFGWIARPIGDVDGDKVTDVAVTAPQNAPYGATNGLVYLFSSRKGKLLWKQVGTTGALLGTSLEAAGDVNGDHIPDVIAGAPGINTAFVYSGRDGKLLLTLTGDSVDHGFGGGVSGVGDVNDDGRADLLVGASGSNSNGAGSGRAIFFSGRDGKRLLAIPGDTAGDAFGSAVGGAGHAILIGAVGAGPNRTGRLFVYDRLSLRPKFVVESDSTGAAFAGMFLSTLGDVDGDGTPDIYATDFPNSASGPATGRAYVFSGRTGKPVITLTGDTPGAGFGIGVGRTGDLNHDGHDDLVIGAWQYPGAAWSGGRVTVYSGKDGAVLQEFTGKVPGETLGFDAVGVGDVDGDGATDFLITSAWSMVNGVRSGRTYIVAGCVGSRTGSCPAVH